MLDPQEKRTFDDMVARLHAEDAKFAERVDNFGSPRRRPRNTMAVLLWTIAPFCIIFGGGTGLIMALVAIGYGANLMLKRSGTAADSDGFSWWSSGRRPGASL